MCVLYAGGSIPSEFCSTTSLSIDVSGTSIECYSGCLTSSPVKVVGASATCPNGSILYRFLVISGVLVVLVLVFSVMLRVYVHVKPEGGFTGGGMSCSAWYGRQCIAFSD